MSVDYDKSNISFFIHSFISFSNVISPSKSTEKGFENMSVETRQKKSKFLPSFCSRGGYTSGLVEIDDAAILHLIEAEWPVITEIVEKVEKEILKFKGDLLTAG